MVVIDDQQFQYIGQPYTDTDNLTEIEDQLETRFEPLTDLWGHGFTAARATQASCTTLGNSRNSPHNTIIGAHQAPQAPEEWAAALCAIAAAKLNDDPARPLQYLELKGILPPDGTDVFTRSERDILLYDGIATWIQSGGKVLIERCITTYQTNVLGTIDPSYLDVETLATLAEIRYQYKARMQTRFITQRFKLADDTFPVQPGTFIVTPKTIKSEIISLFTQLQSIGLIENLEDFTTNLIVERNETDASRVDVMLPADLVGQFRLLCSKLSFIL
jgi:phage tail sheath gpL-like